MTRSRYYKLLGRLPVPVRDIYNYDESGNPISISNDPNIRKDFIDAWKDRRVAQTEVGPMHISTVFLVLDHSWSSDPDALPILFETMIFGDNEDEYQEQYSTWDEAEKGHARAVEYARELLAKAERLLPTADVKSRRIT